jgi:hypothetical protein
LAIGGVVGGVVIEVGHVADQAVGPAGFGQAGLFAGHEFERAVGAEMQQGVGAEIALDPAVERAEGVGGGERAFEHQPHRIALVAEGGLDADEYVAELRAQHEDRRAVGLRLAGRGTPVLFDLAQVAFVAHVVIDRDAGCNVGERAVAGGVADGDGFAQGFRTVWGVDGVASFAQSGERVVQGGEHVEIGGGAAAAGVGGEVEQDDGKAALRALGAAEADQAFHAGGESGGALHVGDHVVLVAAGLGGTAADYGGHDGAVEFGDGDHHGGLDGR